MHRDSFLRLRRDGPPSDPESTDELMVFSSPEGRAGQVDHTDEHHLFAWLDEIPAGGDGIKFDTNPQVGQYLYVETEGGDTTPSGYGQEFYDHSGNGINLAVAEGGNLDLSAIGGGRISLNSTGNLVFTENNTSGFGYIQLNSAFGKMYLQAHDNLDIESALYGFLHFRSDQLYLKSPDRVLIEGESLAYLRALHGSVGIEAGGTTDSVINLAVDGFWRHTIFSHPDSFMGDKPGHLFLNYSDGVTGSRIEFHDLGGGGGPLLRVDIAPDGSVSYHMKAGGTWVTDL